MRKTSVDLEERQYHIAESMASNGDAANQSEAIRDAIEYYAQEMGYKNGTKQDTRLRRGIRRGADAFAVAGMVWTVFTLLFPVGFRLVAIPMFVVAIGLYGVDRGLAGYEPQITKWILRGEKA